MVAADRPSSIVGSSKSENRTPRLHYAFVVYISGVALPSLECIDNDADSGRRWLFNWPGYLGMA
jgi:hypothetical protein